MARLGGNSRRRKKLLLYAVPVLALLGVVAVYAVDVLPVAPSPAALDFTFKLLILLKTNAQSSQANVTAPLHAIGEAGGIWATHQYDSYGVDPSHYPVYMDVPSLACPPRAACLIHVKSKVVHQYTLGDFSAVWGYPVVSQNDTFGIQRNGNLAWELCVGPLGHAMYSNLWGGLVLQPNMDITLFYYDTVNGVGCAQFS